MFYQDIYFYLCIVLISLDLIHAYITMESLRRSGRYQEMFNELLIQLRRWEPADVIPPLEEKPVPDVTWEDTTYIPVIKPQFKTLKDFAHRADDDDFDQWVSNHAW